MRYVHLPVLALKSLTAFSSVAFSVALVPTGENAAEIRSELPGLCVPICECESLAEAVAFAAELAHEGDTVLFSPASTSFDRFQNFEERGKCFSRLVQAL